MSITGCSVSLLLAQSKPQRIRGFLYQGNRKMLFLIYRQQVKADMTCWLLSLCTTKNRTRKTQLRTLFGTSLRKFKGSLSRSFLLLLLFFLFYLARPSVFFCRQIILGASFVVEYGCISSAQTTTRSSFS